MSSAAAAAPPPVPTVPTVPTVPFRAAGPANSLEVLLKEGLGIGSLGGETAGAGGAGEADKGKTGGPSTR